MTPSRRRGAAAVVALVALAGCAGLLGGADAPSGETLTPAPVPATETATAESTTPTPTPTPIATASGTAAAGYDSIRPTCRRPPGLVVYIQVAALANNDPATNEGINTTWRFAAPSNREYTGPYPEFVDLITSSYRPLLEAETVTYGPVEVTRDRASRRVTVENGTSSTTYRWRVARQSGGEFDGCWMTTAVTELSDGSDR